MKRFFLVLTFLVFMSIGLTLASAKTPSIITWGSTGILYEDDYDNMTFVRNMINHLRPIGSEGRHLSILYTASYDPILVRNEPSYASFFEMIDKYALLGKLISFFPTYMEQYLNCPEQGCESEIIDYLEFVKTVEMIGYPQKHLEIYSTVRGIQKNDTVEIKSLQLTSLLDLPLKLGRLKHVVFGDHVDIFEFDTVFTLFEFIDGITWELSFHVTPEQCELRR